jgi:hypothetical protein
MEAVRTASGKTLARGGGLAMGSLRSAAVAALARRGGAGRAHWAGTRTGVSITCKIKCVFGSRTIVFCVPRVSGT